MTVRDSTKSLLELVEISPPLTTTVPQQHHNAKAGPSSVLHLDYVEPQLYPTLSNQDHHRKLQTVLGERHILTNTVATHLQNAKNGTPNEPEPYEENFDYMITFYQEHMCGNKERLMRDLEEVRVASHGENDIEIIMTSRSGDVYRTYRSTTRAIDPVKIVPIVSGADGSPFDAVMLKAFIDEIHNALVGCDKAVLCLRNVLSGAGSQVLLDEGRNGIPRHILRTLSNLAEASDRLQKDVPDLGNAVKAVMDRIADVISAAEDSGNDTSSSDLELKRLWDKLSNLKQRIDRMEARINFELVNRTNSLIQRASNIMSIDEAFKSRQLATSMKRLSWITFIFLPLLFVASLYGMNVDILDNNQAQWWTYVIFAGTTSLVVFSSVYVWKFRRGLIRLIRTSYHNLARLLPLRKRKSSRLLDIEGGGSDDISGVGKHIVLMNMCFQAIRGDNEATARTILARTDPKFLVQALKATPEDNRPFCAFLLAVRQEDESLTRFVADAGEDILAKDKKFGWTILHHAAYSGNIRAVRMALGEDNVQVDALDEGGRTPLHLAFLRGNMEAVELLLRSGAQKGVTDIMGATPMDYAPQVRRASAKDVLKSLPNYPRDIAFSPLPDKVTALPSRR